MERFEFTDFYKFCVSFGLALILFAVIIPWALIRETSWVGDNVVLPAAVAPAIGVSKQQKVVNPIRAEDLDRAKANKDRSRLIRVAFEWVGCVVFFLIGLGMVSFCYGVMKWRYRQVKRDAKENAEISLLIDSIAPKASSKLIASQELLDSKLDDFDNDGEHGGAYARSPGISDLEGGGRDIETRVLDLMEAGMAEYSLRRERRLGSTVADAILLSHDKRSSDVVVEIKFIRKGFGLGWLVEVMQRVSMMVDFYVDRSDRRARGILIVVVANGLMGSIFNKISGEIKSVFVGSVKDVAVILVSRAMVMKGAIRDPRFYNHKRGLLVIQEDE